MCLIDLFADYFFTSDLQFGFKKGISTDHAVFLVRSVCDFYVTRGSNVSICALDLSKLLTKRIIVAFL